MSNQKPKIEPTVLQENDCNLSSYLNFHLETQNTIELDMLILENTARKSIYDLIQPIINRSQYDRQQVHALLKRSENTEQRLKELEYVMNISEEKPAIFEKIFNEIADQEVNIKKSENNLASKIDTLEKNIIKINEVAINCEKRVNFILKKNEHYDSVEMDQIKTN